MTDPNRMPGEAEGDETKGATAGSAANEERAPASGPPSSTLGTGSVIGIGCLVAVMLLVIVAFLIRLTIGW